MVIHSNHAKYMAMISYSTSNKIHTSSIFLYVFFMIGAITPAAKGTKMINGEMGTYPYDLINLGINHTK